MSAVPHPFLCPITHDLMHDPVILGDTGHSYERAAIQHWLNMGHATNPATGEILNGQSHLIPNIQLRQAIEEWHQVVGERLPTLHQILQLSPTSMLDSFWHGTSETAARDIQALGHLLPSSDGFSGPGVYLTRDPNKAKAWARFVAAGRPYFDCLSFYPGLSGNYNGFACAESRPALVRVSVSASLKTKVLDMKGIGDCDFWYETYHRGEIADGMRPSGNWSGDFNELKHRPQEFSVHIEDDLGRLVKNEGRDPGWFRVQNGLSTWTEEGFDAQYIPEMLPHGSQNRVQPFPGQYSCSESSIVRHLMRQTIERMIGDELVLRDGHHATYVCHEVLP